MKKFLISGLTVLAISLLSCGGNNNSRYPQEQNNVSVSPLSNNVSIQADKDNAAFDVNALSSIVRTCTEPKVLEEKINDPANNINNLDLDKDGKVDYLTVTEEGQNVLVIKDANVDPAVVVANLTITPNNDSKTASMQIQGTPQYCGSYNTYYQPSISFGELLFLSYLLRPHSYYHPYYGYHNYPSYYTTRRTVVRTTYRPTTSPYVSNRGGNTPNNRSSIGNPSSSQRKFDVRNTNRPVGSGGFGNSRGQSSQPASRPSAPSYHSSPAPRRSFGGRRR